MITYIISGTGQVRTVTGTDANGKTVTVDWNINESVVVVKDRINAEFMKLYAVEDENTLYAAMFNA